MVTMCNIAHSGRFGTYPEMAAKEGMAAIMFGGNQLDNDFGVAPFGGIKGRLGTNPMSMAFPHTEGRIILLDFATSATAVGKVRVYQARSKSLPGEWLLDSEGRPSSNPQDYFGRRHRSAFGRAEHGTQGVRPEHVRISCWGGCWARTHRFLLRGRGSRLGTRR